MFINENRGLPPRFLCVLEVRKLKKGGFDDAKEKNKANAARDTLPLLRSSCRYPTGSGDLSHAKHLKELRARKEETHQMRLLLFEVT